MSSAELPGDGGPAFPEAIAIGPAGDVYPGMSGMSLRDYFAAQALALLAGRNWDHVRTADGGDQDIISVWARSAYAVADAMLKARASAELIAANEAATSWGAAVGARSERIKEINRHLAAMDAEEKHLFQAEPGYVVKPLEWKEREGESQTFDANTSIGHYVATITDDNRGLWLLIGQTTGNYMIANIGAVRRAAQADYEQRIRSAITATVGTAEPGYVAGFEAGRDAAVSLARKWRDDASEFSDSLSQTMKNICQNLSTAIAALPAPATASAGWQPIDSAPKDGSDVLVFCENSGEQFVCYIDENGGWRFGTFRSGHLVCEPTHWMPLPAAPTNRSAT